MATTMQTPAIKAVGEYQTLIATRPYETGAGICRIHNAVILDMPTRYSVQINKDKHAGVANFSALNHSCDPNVIIDTSTMQMVAIQTIGEGDELCFFYPSTEWQMHTPFICSCGARNCIHVVAGARFLSLSTLETHYLNPHIRELMIALIQDAYTRRMPRPIPRALSVIR